MQYQGTVIRPPSEAHSIILQVTLGCSHNRCTFCGAYRDKPFSIRPWVEILKDIEFARTCCTRQKTLFLADGNALAMPYLQLVRLLEEIRIQLPWVRRVGLYAGCRDILACDADSLRRLKELGLGRIYMGLESGDDNVLHAVNKGATGRDMITAGRMVRDVGIFLSVTCLLGLAGADPEASFAHARNTAKVLNLMRPSQIAVLTLMLLDNTPLGRKAAQGLFSLPDKQQLFLELQAMILALGDFRAQFQANHASNYFQLDGRLPRDREKFLALIDEVLQGRRSVKPERLRAL